MELIHIFEITQEGKMALPISIIGAVIAWAFQDVIKSVAAFLYLRFNDMIHIDDWIEIKNMGVDGMVRSITLTSVIIENWDTTTSTFPTHILLSNHFQNNQNMTNGYTGGRRMLQTFTFDIGWIRKLEESDIELIRTECNITDGHPLYSRICEGMNNLEAFRLYVYHYLHTHSKVSQTPRLFVRWLRQTPEGMQLELYAFITETKCAAYEWEQSRIIEHILKCIPYFGMRLFQKPSSFDVRNSMSQLTDKNIYYGKQE